MRIIRPRHVGTPRGPRSDDLDDWLDTHGGSLLSGTISGHDLPFELEPEEILIEQHELVDALERKRPMGFQADWSEFE